MITERVLSESGVSVSLFKRRPESETALAEGFFPNMSSFKEFGAKTRYTASEKNIIFTRAVFDGAK